MKKVLALLFVASVFALASCGEKKAEGSTDSASASVDTTAKAPESTPADSTAGDSAKGDSAKAAH